MLDFGKIVYLDVQKTGSSYIARFLKNTLELPLLARQMHAAPQARRPDAFYFISVRNPLAQYISLYRYGLEGRGGMVARFSEAGMAGYYQPDPAGFERWLAFIIAPENAAFFGTRYHNSRPGLIGLQSFRFLSLSFINPVPLLKAVREKSALRALYAEKKIHGHVVKTETLNQDLEKLLDSEVGTFFKPREQVMSYLQNSRRAKQSFADVDISPQDIRPDLIEELKKREWFLFETFYPQEITDHV